MKQKAVLLTVAIALLWLLGPSQICAQNGNDVKQVSAIPPTDYTIFSKKVDGKVSEVFWDPETKTASISFHDPSISSDENQDFYWRFQTYDLDADTILWERLFDIRHKVYSKQGRFIYENIANRTTCLNPQTGRREWSKVGNFVGRSGDVGFYFEYKRGSRTLNKLTSFDLDSGEKLWTDDLKYDYGWSDIQSFGDDEILVIGNGIHKVDLNEGVQWSHVSSCAVDQDNGSLIVASGLLFGLVGALVATGVTFEYPGGTFTGLHSNIAEIDDHIYFASKTYIFKVNPNNGSLFWKEPIFPSSVGSSEIHDMGDHVLFINTGHAKAGGQKIQYTKPFISFYTKDEGKGDRYKKIKKNGALDDVIVDKNGVSLVYHDRIVLLNEIEDLTPQYTKTTEEELDKKKIGQFYNTLYSGITYQCDPETKIVTELLPTQYAFERGDGAFFIYDSNVGSVTITDEEKLYSSCGTYEGYEFITNGLYQGCVVDSDLNIVYELGFSPNAKIEEGWLVDYYGQYFQATDIDEIISELNSGE